MPTILVVDDSEVDRRLVGGLLQREANYVVRFAHNGREALNDIRKLVPDLVLTDMNMPERDGLGLEFLTELRATLARLKKVRGTIRLSSTNFAGPFCGGSRSECSSSWKPMSQQSWR